MVKIHCLKCRKYTENKNLNVSPTSNGRMLLAYCAVCNSK